jgi:hypothetical protein
MFPIKGRVHHRIPRCLHSEELQLRPHRQNDTGDTWPFLQPPHRLPFAKHADVNDMFEDTKCRGVTEESDSPWTSPVTLVQKKDGSVRFFMGYHRLNVTK